MVHSGAEPPHKQTDRIRIQPTSMARGASCDEDNDNMCASTEVDTAAVSASSGTTTRTVSVTDLAAVPSACSLHLLVKSGLLAMAIVPWLLMVGLVLLLAPLACLALGVCLAR